MAKAASAIRLTGAMLTDVGSVRSHNEDSCAFSTSAPLGESASDSLMIVADGMGGHSAGEVASRLAVEVIRRAYFFSKGPAPQKLADAFYLAHRAIMAHAEAYPECEGMGTACTALAFHQNQLFLAHIGDTRAYILRNKSLTQLTNDHTLVARLVRDRLLTQEQGEQSEFSNVLTQALGTSRELQPEIWSEAMPVLERDVIVMCSDGLHRLVSSKDIADAAGSCPPRDACAELVRQACAAGGHDNVTVGVFRAERELTSSEEDQRATRRLSVPSDF